MSTYPNEANPIPDGWHDANRQLTVAWTDPRLARVTRLRLLTERGFPFWDVSYCHGELVDGTPVTVALPFDQLPRRWESAVIAHAKRDGVYAKRLGFFNPDVVSKLW